jgi:flagellar basal body-associated protein FliL
VLWVSIAVAVLVLAAGGVTAFLLLKKKNRK